MLSEYNGVIYMGDRVVVPVELRASILETLHAAHQGTTSMRLRAERNLFWPNMARDIANKRMSCNSCDGTAPSQSPEPPITPVTPEYPFQHICSDFSSLKGHNFLSRGGQIQQLAASVHRKGWGNLLHITCICPIIVNKPCVYDFSIVLQLMSIVLQVNKSY